MRENHILSVAFFGDFVSRTSFRETNDQYVLALRKLGVDVRTYGREAPLNGGDKADLLLVHPGFSAGGFNGRSHLRTKYRVIGFKDVLNYSLPGPAAEFELRNPSWDFVALNHIPPALAGARDGPKLLHWLDGIPDDYAKTPLRETENPVARILIWADNSGFDRKGIDLDVEVLKRLQHEGLRFDVLVKSRWVNLIRGVFGGMANVSVLPHYLDRAGVRRVFDACDILLHLHRGGGLELTPMEAIARGLITVVPDAGACKEYANAVNSLLVPTHEWSPDPAMLKERAGDCDGGVGYEADLDKATERMRFALKRMHELRVSARPTARAFARRWGISRVVGRNLQILGEAFPELDIPA